MISLLIRMEKYIIHNWWSCSKQKKCYDLGVDDTNWRHVFVRRNSDGGVGNSKKDRECVYIDLIIFLRCIIKSGITFLCNPHKVNTYLAKTSGRDDFILRVNVNIYLTVCLNTWGRGDIVCKIFQVHFLYKLHRSNFIWAMNTLLSNGNGFTFIKIFL